MMLVCPSGVLVRPLDAGVRFGPSGAQLGSSAWLADRPC